MFRTAPRVRGLNKPRPPTPRPTLLLAARQQAAGVAGVATVSAECASEAVTPRVRSITNKHCQLVG